MYAIGHLTLSYSMNVATVGELGVAGQELVSVMDHYEYTGTCHAVHLYSAMLSCVLLCVVHW